MSVALRPVEGDQLKFPIPVAFNCAVSPSHALPFGPASTTGAETVTSTVSVFTQPVLLTCTTNTVVPVGVAIGFAAVGSLITPAGLQLKLLPPGPVGSPPSGVPIPEQMVTSLPASAAGRGEIFTLTFTGVLSQPKGFVALTTTLPGPGAPQSTVMLLLPWPVMIAPPFTVQLKSAPVISAVL